MILGTLIHHTLYTGINPRFKKAFDYLLNTDFNTLALGKHTLEGEDLFVIYQQYESKEASECMLESHKKYIDIQYMVSGEELIGITQFNGQIPSVAYDDAKDVAFYNPVYTTTLKLDEGTFAIFFPHDLHMPCIKTDQITTVRKAVFKIRVE